MQAKVETAEAALAKAEIDLSRTEVTAPFNAIVASRSVDLGAQVSTAPRLASLVGTDEYWLELSLPVDQLRWIEIPRFSGEPGSALRVFDEAAWGKGTSREGRVIRLAGEVEAEGRMGRVFAVVADPLGLDEEHAGAPPLLIGLESLCFESDRGGPGSGAALTIERSHRDIDTPDRAGEDLAARLAGFGNVIDIDDGFTPGKKQFDFRLKPEGHSPGLTVRDVARQVRNAFYGAEALRQQRGRSEIKVKVRLPEEQRTSEYDIEQLLIRRPKGRDVPLLQVAEVTCGRAYTSITRRDGRRTISVTADVEPIDQVNQVLATLTDDILPELVRGHHGLTYQFEGRQVGLKESLDSLIRNFRIALLGIYVLLTIPFRSYMQPLVVMMAIPFGIVGAVVGHLVMGYSLSIISLMGIVALAGVVVNDALVMIDYANRLRRDGTGAREAIHSAGIRRFRPVMLTSLTTFGCLAPMIFETSRQARFMIPMAISLGYGIVFATAISACSAPISVPSARNSGCPERGAAVMLSRE